MSYLLAALFLSARLLDAQPTGRYMGSEVNSAAPSHASDDVIVDADLQKLWDSAPSSSHHSPPRKAALDDKHVGNKAPSTLVPTQRAAGQQRRQYTASSPAHHHHTNKQVASKSDGSSTHSGSNLSLSDLHLLSPMRWDSSPSPSQQSPPRAAAPEHAHMGHSVTSAQVPGDHPTGQAHSAPSIPEPASKRLKKHHAAILPPPHHHTFPPVVLESHGSGTHAGPSWIPSSHQQGLHDQRLIATAATLRGASNVPSPMSPPTKLKSSRLSRSGLSVTPKAHPKEVENALRFVHDSYTPGGNAQIQYRTSILKMAVASVAEGCTSIAHYRKCIDQKYGEGLMKSHHAALGRIIQKDMETKATDGLGTSIKSSGSHSQAAGANTKWFAVDRKKQEEEMKLKLPPLNRNEPQIIYGDESLYEERIKHLDPFQLTCSEYIKQGRLPFEAEPDRWNKDIPKWAMVNDLHSKGASEKMINHFQKVHYAMIQSVSYRPAWLIAHQMALIKSNRVARERSPPQLLQLLLPIQAITETTSLLRQCCVCQASRKGASLYPALCPSPSRW